MRKTLASICGSHLDISILLLLNVSALFQSFQFGRKKQSSDTKLLIVECSSENQK